MKTCLYSANYLNGVGLDDNAPRYNRVAKWLTYIYGIQKHIGFDNIYFADNMSSTILLKRLTDHYPVKIIRYDEHYCRTGNLGYPYIWRAFYDMFALMAEGYEKIIWTDTDCYILSQRLADFVKNHNSGWEALWCPTYNFPESSLSILNKDSFHIYQKFIQTPWNTD